MSVLRVLLDPTDRRVAARGRLFLLLSLVVLLATAVLATYGRTWSWTGFKGNENVWQWLSLLLEPVALGIVLMQLLAPPNPRRFAVGLLLVFGVLAALMVGGYALGWTWTGFAEYRLWDWLQLLVLPLVVILMPLWMRAGARVSAPVAWILVAILASLVVCFAGGYVFRWDWTGCVGKTFRDWLNLLITPFAIPLVCAWFLAAREIADSAPTSPPPDRPTATEEKGTSLAATARD